MKQTTFIFVVLILLPIITIEARGGRGRGGFGGLFGTWRKTKSKHTNSRNSGRSVINGMPMHTTITKNRPSKTNQPIFNSRPQTGNRAHHAGGYNHYPHAQYVPPGATHYATHAAIPSGAVYVPHTPPYTSSSELSDFLMGYMTGRLLTISTYPHQHVHHIHYQQISQDAGKKVIIIENGTVSNETKFNQWPMNEDVPLFPFNSSLETEASTKPNREALFKRPAEQDAVKLATTPAATEDNVNTNSTLQTPPGGIICMPMIFNETDAADNNKVMQVEKLVCFPAPPPPPQSFQEADGSSCVIRYFIESNPNNPSETIEVPRKHCTPSTTVRSEPVVGDIFTESRYMNAVDRILSRM